MPKPRALDAPPFEVIRIIPTTDGHQVIYRECYFCKYKGWEDLDEEELVKAKKSDDFLLPLKCPDRKCASNGGFLGRKKWESLKRSLGPRPPSNAKRRSAR